MGRAPGLEGAVGFSVQIYTGGRGGTWSVPRRRAPAPTRGSPRACRIESESGEWIFYRRSPGPASRSRDRPLLMLHPTLLRADIYAPQLQDLSKHLDVIAVDLRGHGRSSPPPVAQAYDHASQLEEFLDALEIPSVDILGTEMGGAVALDFAECFPERVGSLVLVNSSAFLYAFPSESYFCLSDALDRGGVDAARELWLQRSDYDFTRKNDAVFRFVREVLSEYRGWHFTQDDRMTWRGGGIDGYSALKMRALIIYGEHCGPDYKAIAHQLDHVMEQGSLRCIPGCGMLPNLESIDVFNRLVLEFLSGVKGAA